MTATGTEDEAVFQLRKALATAGSELPATHPWFFEGDRWKELIFALLIPATGLPEARVRELTDLMQDLDLLEVKKLAVMQSAQDKVHAQRIVDLMIEMGVNEEHASVALNAILEATHFVSQKYNGKLQLLIRGYGELILNEMTKNLDLKSLSREQVQIALTYWLQNALSMPLSLSDERMEAYCQRHGFSPAQVRDAADELGFNLSYLDDLIDRVEASSAQVTNSGDNIPSQDCPHMALGQANE